MTTPERRFNMADIDISDLRTVNDPPDPNELDDPDDLYDEDDEFDDAEDDMDDAMKAKLAAAIAQIDAQFGKPPVEQVAAFTEAHQVLQETLNRIDET